MKCLISATAVCTAAHSPPYTSISVNDTNLRENKAWFGVFEVSAETTLTGQLWDVFEEAPEWSSTIWGYLVPERVCTSGYCISSVLISTSLGCWQGFGIFVFGSSKPLSFFSKFDLWHFIIFIKFVCVKESFGEWAGNAGPWQVPQSSRQQNKTVLQLVKEKGGWLKSTRLFEAPVPNAQWCGNVWPRRNLCRILRVEHCASQHGSGASATPSHRLQHRPWESVKAVEVRDYWIRGFKFWRHWLILTRHYSHALCRSTAKRRRQICPVPFASVPCRQNGFLCRPPFRWRFNVDALKALVWCAWPMGLGPIFWVSALFCTQGVSVLTQSQRQHHGLQLMRRRRRRRKSRVAKDTTVTQIDSKIKFMFMYLHVFVKWFCHWSTCSRHSPIIFTDEKIWKGVEICEFWSPHRSCSSAECLVKPSQRCMPILMIRFERQDVIRID